jgi:hypothetical protein
VKQPKRVRGLDGNGGVSADPAAAFLDRMREQYHEPQTDAYLAEYDDDLGADDIEELAEHECTRARGTEPEVCE